MDLLWSLIALQVGLITALIFTFRIVCCDRCILWVKEHTGIADASIQKMGVSYTPEQTMHMYRILGKYIKKLQNANRWVGLVCSPGQDVEQQLAYQEVRGVAIFHLITDKEIDLFCRNSHKMIYLIAVDQYQGDVLVNMSLPSNVRFRTFDRKGHTINLMYTPLHRFETE